MTAAARPAPIDQTTFGDPDGNCLEACFATVTGIPLSEIPHFLSDHWFYEYCIWFKDRGWELDWHDGADVPAGMVIASGPAVRGLEHSTVYLDGQLWHDPHPSKDGLISIRDWMTLVRQDIEDGAYAMARERIKAAGI